MNEPTTPPTAGRNGKRSASTSVIIAERPAEQVEPSEPDTAGQPQVPSVVDSDDSRAPQEIPVARPRLVEPR
jgi:hypothetical protein